MKTESEGILIKYLLGELPEAAQLQIEERYFADKEFYEQLVALHNELLYDYAQGELSSEMGRRFERRYLSSSKGRRKAEAAGAILDRVFEVRSAQAQPPGPLRKRKTLAEFLRSLFELRFPVLLYSAGAAVVVLMIGCAWLLV